MVTAVSDLMKASELSGRLGVSMETVRRWASLGILPSPLERTDGGWLYFRRQDIERWLAGRAHDDE
jgi:DNA-binding transcriptional MerR regulator